MNCVMFAVNREQRFALAARLGGDQFSRGDQAFLVSKSNDFAGTNRFVSCFQAGNAYNRADHEVCVGMSCNANRSGGTVRYFNLAQASGS